MSGENNSLAQGLGSSFLAQQLMWKCFSIVLLAHPGGRRGRPGYCFSQKQSSEEYECKCDSLIIPVLRKGGGGGGFKVFLAQWVVIEKVLFALPAVQGSCCHYHLRVPSKQSGLWVGFGELATKSDLLMERKGWFHRGWQRAHKVSLRTVTCSAAILIKTVTKSPLKPPQML